MARPVWITKGGFLGTVPELEFFNVPLEITNPENDIITFSLTSGELPPGIQIVRSPGAIQGVPVVLDPIEVDEAREYRFTVRAKAQTSGVIVDRSFSVMVTNLYPPYIIPRTSDLGFVFDGTYYSKTLQAIEPNPNARLTWRIISGELPLGVNISDDGVISGYVKILPVGIESAGTPGYDTNNGLGIAYYDQGSYDSSGRSTNRQYTFTVEVTDGSNFDTLTYALHVASKGSFTCDQGEITDLSVNPIPASITCDNDDLTIDHDNRYVPVITTPAQSLPIVRQENYFAYKFDAIDFENDELTWAMQVAEGGSYDQGAIDIFGWGESKPRTVLYFDTDNFELTVTIDTSVYPEGSTFDIVGVWYESDAGEVTLLEEVVDFEIGETGTRVDFTNPGPVPDRGRVGIDIIINTPNNTQSGAGGFDTSLFDQSESKLPPTLTIDENGWLNGYVDPQVEDIKTYNFIVSAYKTDAPVYESNKVQFELTILGSLTDIITWTTPSDLGTVIPGEVSQLSVQAVSTREQDIVYHIAPKSKLHFPQGLSLNILENGYISGRTTFRGFRLDDGAITFDKHKTHFDNQYEITVVATTADGLTSSEKTFTLRVDPRYTRPYENLYLKALPTKEQRDLFLNIVNNQAIFPDELIYRKQDPWFGRSKTIKFLALAGINPSTAADYIAAMRHNHYNKVINFGAIKTARAVDEFYNTKYEVVYVEVDDPFNRNDALVPESIGLGERTSSFGSQFLLSNSDRTINFNPYLDADGKEYDTVYPNTFENMNQRIISNLGYSARGVFPDWMLSVQKDKTVIGFKRAVVLAYTIPGASDLIAYRLRNSNLGLSRINFSVDRYQLDNILSSNFDIANNKFYDSSATTFDRLIVGPGEKQLSVTYAVNQSFDSIHLRSKNYINSDQLSNPIAGPGIDGIKNFKHGETLIFAQQEHFNNVDNANDGWIEYQNLYIGDIPGDDDKTELATEGGTRIGNTLSGPNSIWNFTNGTITIQATGLPYHSYGSELETEVIAAQNYMQRWPNHAGTNYSNPAHPQVPPGIVGYWLNGVAMYNPTDGNTAPIGYSYIPGSEYVSASQAGLSLGYTWGEDSAGGHANGYNRYHYHDFHFAGAWGSGIGATNGSVGIAETSVIPYLQNGLTHNDGHSKILGFTLDGYPVYGPYGYIDPEDETSGVRRMESSYSTKPDYSHRDGLINDPARYPLGMFIEDYQFDDHGTLDIHNGRWAVTPDYPNGTYAYYATVDQNGDPAFPYVIGPTWYGHAATPGINDLTNGLGYAPSNTDLLSSAIVDDYDAIYGFDSYKILPGYREKSLTVLSKLLITETTIGSNTFDIEYQYGSNLIGKSLVADSGIPANTKIVQQQTVDISVVPGVVNLVTRVVTNNESEVKLSIGSTIRIVNAVEAAFNGLGNSIKTISIPSDLKNGMSLQGVGILENTYVTEIDRNNNLVYANNTLAGVSAGDIVTYLQTNQRGGVWRINVTGSTSLINYDVAVDYAVNEKYSKLHGVPLTTILTTFENGIDGEIDWRVLNEKHIIFTNKDNSDDAWSLLDLFDLEAYDTDVDPALYMPIPAHLRREIYKINIIETNKPVERFIDVNGKTTLIHTEKIVKLTRVGTSAFAEITNDTRIRIRTGDKFGGKDFQLDYTNNYVAMPAIESDELVRLEFIQEVDIGTKVKVADGKSHGFSFLTYDATLGTDQTVPKYNHWEGSIEADPTSNTKNYTRFDGDGTRFFNYRDVYHDPESGDKYLKFPQLGVFI